MTFECSRLSLHVFCLLHITQYNIDDICQGETIGIESVFNLHNILSMLDDTFREKKTHCQLNIIAWRAHNHCQATTSNTYLKRLLYG